uniref:peptidyl-tRNA hydrolase n=1 Tax=Cucumis melo TaxID=3656 RepID=A0A9I9CDN0_CUCME
MNIGASISSVAALRLPFSIHSFRTSRTLISFPSLSLLHSPTFHNFSSITSSITASMSTSSSPTTDQPALDDKKPAPPPKPWLIVGLGNPGKKYDRTRHNVGFEMVDAVAEAEGISISNVSFKALIGKGFIGDVPVMLAKPQTFMNASGESVGAIVSYYKIPLKQVLVIFDDLDLPFAKLRMLPKGGHGGHNGMRSIIDHFKGSRDFPRLRIGTCLRALLTPPHCFYIISAVKWVKIF